MTNSGDLELLTKQVVKQVQELLIVFDHGDPAGLAARQLRAVRRDGRIEWLGSHPCPLRRAVASGPSGGLAAHTIRLSRLSRH
jgi:hypothetical protein